MGRGWGGGSQSHLMAGATLRMRLSDSQVSGQETLRPPHRSLPFPPRLPVCAEIVRE